MRRFYYYSVIGAAGFLFGQGIIVMWPEWSAWTWWGLGAAVLIAGLGGLHLVNWVSRLFLARTLPDFDQSVGRLLNDNYLVREQAARDLAKLARTRPSRFHIKVMRKFEGYLAYPPFYGASHEKAGQIDPYSPDTAAVMEEIVSRTKEQLKAERNANYRFSLNPNSPFKYCDKSFWFRGERLVSASDGCSTRSSPTP